MTTGTEDKLYNQYYVLEYRTYKGYDYGLKVGPYYFGYLDNPLLGQLRRSLRVPGWPVDQLLGYLAGRQQHRAASRDRVCCCRSTRIRRPCTRVDGPAIWRNRIQTYDSTFTLDRDGRHPEYPSEQRVVAGAESAGSRRCSMTGRSYYDPTNPLGSVITPEHRDQDHHPEHQRSGRLHADRGEAGEVAPQLSRKQPN